MKKTSVKPAKVKPVKKVKAKKAVCPKCKKNYSKGMATGLVIGFAVGAGIVAVIDYLDERHTEARRIEKGSDADYYYNN